MGKMTTSVANSHRYTVWYKIEVDKTLIDKIHYNTTRSISAKGVTASVK